jgi:hypothetical protein
MREVVSDNFRTISVDDHGEPARCSYCSRGMTRVVVLPLTRRPELEDHVQGADSEELWVGLCAYCVLGMAKALQKGEDKRP